MCQALMGRSRFFFFFGAPWFICNSYWYSWRGTAGIDDVVTSEYFTVKFFFSLGGLPHGYAVWDLQWARWWSLQDSTLSPRCVAINEDSGGEDHAVADTATEVTPAS